MSYEFLVTDHDGRERSELPGVNGKRLSIALRGTSTSAFTVPGDGDDADLLLEGGKLLRVYESNDSFLVDRDRQLLGHLRLISADEVASDASHTVATVWANPFWTFGRRLVGNDLSPGYAGYSRGAPDALVDAGVILSELVSAANAIDPTGARVASLVASKPTYVGPWFMKPLAEVFSEISGTLDGPDFRFAPIELEESGAYAAIDIGPSLGTTRPGAAFEFGDGRLNVASFTRSVSIEGSANQVFAPPAGWPGTHYTAADAANETITGTPAQSRVAVTAGTPDPSAPGLLEAVVSSEIVSFALREQLADEHYVARHGARQTITFTPTVDIQRSDGLRRIPRIGRDFDVGDIVPFRATVTGRDGRPRKRLNIDARVYGYDVTVDDAGAGTPSITVTPT